MATQQYAEDTYIPQIDTPAMADPDAERKKRWQMLHTFYPSMVKNTPPPKQRGRSLCRYARQRNGQG
jgi:hypothetical protein